MAAEQVKKHYVLGVFPFLLGNRDFLFHSCDFCLYFIEKKYLILKYKYMYRYIKFLTWWKMKIHIHRYIFFVSFYWAQSHKESDYHNMKDMLFLV